MPVLAVPLLALSIAAPGATRALAPRRLISRCLSRASPELTGLSALRGACAGIGHAIDGLGLDAFLPPKWRQKLTPHSLAGLLALAKRYSGPPLTSAADAGTLRMIARDLKPPAPPPSLWSRIESWALHWTAPLRRGIDSWARSLGRKSNAHTLRTALTAFTALLLVVMLAVLVFGLRSASGLRSGRSAARRRRTRSKAPRQHALEGNAPQWSALREQPAQLLRVLVDALARSHRIGRERHLTCRELASRARFETAGQRDQFTRVALLAERALYGPGTPPAVPEETLRAVMSLHADLQTTANPRERSAP